MKAFITLLLITLTSFSWSKTDKDCSPQENENLKSIQSALEAYGHKPNFSKSFCEGLKVCGSNCKQASEDFKKLTTIYKTKQIGTCGMNSDELGAIIFYIELGFNCLNGYLRDKKAPIPQIDYLVTTLNRALDKLPSYEGYVVRGSNLPDDIKAKHQVGAVVDYPAFTSSSTLGVGVFGVQQLMIYSRTGKPIMGFSSDSESEVLFPSQRKIKILDKFEEGQFTYYAAIEVDPKADPVAEAKLEKEVIKTFYAQKDKINEYETPHDRWICPGNFPVREKIQQKFIPGLKSY
jgi:hypothetical protein